MTLHLLYADEPDNWDIWTPAITKSCADAGLDTQIHGLDADPRLIDYAIYAPSSGLRDFTPFSKLKAVLSLWAGVDTIVANETITCPIARMSDDGLKEGMVEYVTGHILRHHLSTDLDVMNAQGPWTKRKSPPLARNTTVGILGCGALGQACAQALQALNFTVLGWARSKKPALDFPVHAGDAGLKQVLGIADHLVLLLPDTPATKDIINSKTIAMMKPGVSIINAGRGPSINDQDLIAGLDAGTISAATLDVFRQEPLPGDHPFWAHNGVTVTPHIAAETRPETAALLIAQNIQRVETGKAPLFEVDRETGY